MRARKSLTRRKQCPVLFSSRRILRVYFRAQETKVLQKVQRAYIRVYATAAFSTRVSDIANNRLSGEYGSRESYHLSWVYMRQLSRLILREKEQKSERGERWYWGQIGKLVKLFDFGLINHPIDPRKKRKVSLRRSSSPPPICFPPPSILLLLLLPPFLITGSVDCFLCKSRGNRDFFFLPTQSYPQWR